MRADPAELGALTSSRFLGARIFSLKVLAKKTKVVTLEFSGEHRTVYEKKLKNRKISPIVKAPF